MQCYRRLFNDCNKLFALNLSTMIIYFCFELNYLNFCKLNFSHCIGGFWIGYISLSTLVIRFVIPLILSCGVSSRCMCVNSDVRLSYSVSDGQSSWRLHLITIPNLFIIFIYLSSLYDIFNLSVSRDYLHQSQVIYLHGNNSE